MAEVIRLPQMYDDMSPATIKWLKQIGDPIKEGDILAEVETDKATMELENYQQGYLLYQLNERTASVDQVIAIVGEKDEDISALLKELKSIKAVPPREKSGFLNNLSKSFSSLLSTQPDIQEQKIDTPKDLLKGEIRSIRTFIGASNYELSRKFYQKIGFHESEISEDMCYYSIGRFGFYLQKYYVKDWVNNSMVFLEVNDAQETYAYLQSLALPENYEGAKLTPVKEEAWGRECFLHDPSGVLWHFGEFYH